MFPNKYLHSKKPTEWENMPLNSPLQDQQGRKRQLPYKLLSFPSSKCSLWDHTTFGDVTFLSLFYERHPRINIDKTILSTGHIFTSPESKNAAPIRCTLCGRLSVTEGEMQVVIIFTKLKFNEDIMKTRALPQNLADYEVPVIFSTTHGKNEEMSFYQTFKAQAVPWLQDSSHMKNSVVLNNFVKCKAQCQFENQSRGIICNIQFCLATFNTRFIINPILPITIIRTALSRGLSDSAGNTFLHGEPKSGYVTMDETRRVLLVLDSDPKVTLLPVVGIWISGVETVQHPFVWASCIRYLNMGFFGKRICVPPDPFLVLVYEKPTFTPQFYDCILDSPSTNADFAVYSGSCESVLDRANMVKPHEMRELSQTNSNYLSFTLELIDDTSNAPQKTSPLLENPERKNLSREGRSSSVKDLHHDTGEAFESLKNTRCVCSCRSCESHGKPAVEIAIMGTPKLSNTPNQEIKCTENSLEDSTIPNHNLYGLYLAQEQQIQRLKEQLGILLHQQNVATLSNSSSSDEDNYTPLVNKTNPSPVKVNSAGTMTSLAWPAPPLVKDCHYDQRVTTDDDGYIEELPSPEIERKQAQNSGLQASFLNSMVDSLANLQFNDVGESMESTQSSLVVDLHDYPESVTSVSRHSDSSEFNTPHHSDLYEKSSNLFGSSGKIKTPASVSETEDDSAFYGNLLKKIQTILSHQESPDGNMATSETQHSTNNAEAILLSSNERSHFDSVLIPHLNYLSMLPTDMSSDQSLEFCSLALKYLNKCSSKLPPPALGRVFDRSNMTSLQNNLSFASRQYFGKHGINDTANDQKNLSKADLS